MSLATTAVRLKVTLKDVSPAVERRIVVPLAIRLDRLHLTLQAAFGWANAHLYTFTADGMTWGIPDPGFDVGGAPADARKSRLYDIVKMTGAKTIHYLYDFGDGWDHVLKLERWFENTPPDGLPFLLEASGRCPPEDVGGPEGYAQFLEAIADASHPRHAEFAQNFTEAFDPREFNKRELEKCVDELAQKWTPRPRKK
jgi:hypothetical protein